MKNERLWRAGRVVPPMAEVISRKSPLMLVTLALSGCSTDRMPILSPVGPIGEAGASVFWISVIVMALIGIPVILGTWWIAWRYRASSDHHDYDRDFDDSPIIHQVTMFVPLFTITILGALTWVYTHRLDPYRPLPGDERPYEIQAISLDYKWLFIYPEEGIATINELVAPTDRPVTLRMTSDPMMTAIFIPGLINQIYTMPGMETRANFLADREATMQGANAMYSGPGFEYQRFKTRLVSADKFSEWTAAVKAGQAAGTQSKPRLDRAGYDALTAPTTDTPVTHYASVDPTLFVQAVQKYMPTYVMNPLPTREEFDRKITPAGTVAHADHDKGTAMAPAAAAQPAMAPAMASKHENGGH